MDSFVKQLGDMVWSGTTCYVSHAHDFVSLASNAESGCFIVDPEYIPAFTLSLERSLQCLSCHSLEVADELAPFGSMCEPRP